MAAEILVVTPAIRALIRDDKIHQIYSMMQSGKKYGMQTMNDALYQLYMSARSDARRGAAGEPRPDEFLRMIGRQLDDAVDGEAAMIAAMAQPSCAGSRQATRCTGM